VINDADFQAVTPDSSVKDRFVIVDAVGVTETELVDTQPLDREPTVPLDRLLKQLSWGVRDTDALSTIGARLSRLDRRLTSTDREQLEQLSGGTTLKEIAGAKISAVLALPAILFGWLSKRGAFHGQQDLRAGSFFVL